MHVCHNSHRQTAHYGGRVHIRPKRLDSHDVPEHRS
jgi:hypothetical protein